MSKSKYYDKRLGASIVKHAALFLFDTGEIPEDLDEAEVNQLRKEFSQGLEMRSRIKGPATMKALTFYGILRDGFDSEAAQIVSDVIKRLSIGENGGGREEARDVLRGNTPQEIEIPRGQA